MAAGGDRGGWVRPPCLWCVTGEPGRCSCLADCGARPGVLGSPGCPLAPGAGPWPAEAWPLGPQLTALWEAVPGLELVDGAVLDQGAAEAEAITARVQGERRVCVLCGRREAVIALVVRPQWGEDRRVRWADVCHPCYALVRAEAEAG